MYEKISLLPEAMGFYAKIPVPDIGNLPVSN